MQYTYTAVITEKDGTFYAKVPDVDGCITTAPTLTEAIALITDALNLCLVGLEDEDITPNEPTPQAEIPHLPTDILTIIQADTIKYRSMTDTKAVRKNVSLPAWMSKLADKHHNSGDHIVQNLRRHKRHSEPVHKNLCSAVDVAADTDHNCQSIDNKYTPAENLLHFPMK